MTLKPIMTQEQVINDLRELTEWWTLLYSHSKWGVGIKKIKQEWTRFKYVYNLVFSKPIKDFNIKETPLNQEFTSYTSLIESLFTILYKYQCIERIKDTWVLLTSNIYDTWYTSFKHVDMSEFDNHSITELTTEDIDDIITTDNIVKAIVQWNVIGLYMKQWTVTYKQYSKLTFVNLMIRYIQNLVHLKASSWKSINNKITLYYQSSWQDLHIIESDNKDYDESTTKWLIDTNLTNTYYVLCSLEDLSIDERKLKMWINKTLISDQEITKVYFN